MKKCLKYLLLAIALGGCVLLGSSAKDNTYNLGKSVEILVNLMRSINLFYVDDVAPDKLTDAAAGGMNRILDPYSEYLPAERMEDFELRTTGKYGGVGSLIRQDGEWVEFNAPYKGSPADKAGIRPGDRIVAIDGRSTKGFTTQQVSTLLKGDPGKSVKLTIAKFPSREEVELKLTRERIAIPGIPYYGMVAEGVGYICHEEFTEGCSGDFLKAYEALKAEGARSLILDYRSNAGGLLQEAVKILSFFLPTGSEVVSTRSSKRTDDMSYKTEGAPIAADIPLVVLVDGSSASAAEIVAGALQDNDRAVLVGQRTFGKGLVQGTFPLGHGAYAKFTTAKYYLPSGRCIQAIDYGAHTEGGTALVPDSLINEFTTRAGRKVYDGGGVMPDVKMEPEYVSTFAVVANAQGFVDQFLADYCARHYEELEGAVVPTKYRFDDEAYEEWRAFMADKEVAWESAASRRWKEFKAAAEKERWREDMKEQMEAIENNLKVTTADNVELYKSELQKIIENQMVARYCYVEGGIAHTLPEDKVIQKAVELLGDTTLYHHILAEQDTERK